MRKSSRDVPEMQESSRDVPEGFAICTGRIPNEQHGSKAPTQWTCEVRGVLPGGFARCGVFCPAVCMVQKSRRDVPEMRKSSRDSGFASCGVFCPAVCMVQKSSRDVPEMRKVVGTYPKCGKVVGTYPKWGKVVGTYPK
ncbi:hypothetical protein CDL15_Pgr005972 [Punica granatum]|uniref:Uncharacterized protein n=1 Tax=Punica granatum TaxID=22663 RepID=A0A218XQJ4_PUNGR|nr:hypothetical protein CDL15_Pgr005972 [Punica granatum]